MRRPLLTLLAAVVWGLTLSCAQEGPWPSSGIGALVPEKGVQALHINFPLAEIDLFLPERSGTPVGMITRKNSLNLMYTDLEKRLAFRVSEKDLVELESKGYCLKYFEIRDQYVKVLVNSTGHGYWISLKDLDYMRYTAMPWINVLSSRAWVCQHQVEMGVNLRKEADAASFKIMLVKGIQMGIVLNGKTQGQWAGVTVNRYGKKPCRYPEKNPQPLESESGWIKVIDDAGMPNIWFAPDCR